MGLPASRTIEVFLRELQVTQYSSDGALELRSHKAELNAGSASTDMTLATPTESLIGSPIYIVCTDASNSCTVTLTTGNGSQELVFDSAGEAALIVGATTSQWHIVSRPDQDLSGETLRINQDADSGTDEDPELVLLGGDGVASPNDDIVRTRFFQDSTAETLTLFMERNRNGSGFSDIPTELILGINSASVDHDPILRLRGGDGVSSPNDDVVTSTFTQDSTAEELIFTQERDRNGAGSSNIAPTLAIGSSTVTDDTDSTLKFYGGTGGANADAQLRFDASTDGLLFENHTQLGFFGSSGASQQTYTLQNNSTNRTVDADGSLANIGDNLATLVADLQSLGLLG